jgi:hypothetical protein
MPFTVVSRVNHPLAITLDDENSLHMNAYDSKEVDDKFRECKGLQIAIRNKSLVIRQGAPSQEPAQIEKKANFEVDTHDNKKGA